MGAPLGQCAKCGEWNMTRLSNCARCGAELPWATAQQRKTRAPREQESAEIMASRSWLERQLRAWNLLSSETVVCRFCDERIDVWETRCPHCGANLVSPGRERWK